MYLTSTLFAPMMKTMRLVKTATPERKQKASRGDGVGLPDPACDYGGLLGENIFHQPRYLLCSQYNTLFFLEFDVFSAL